MSEFLKLENLSVQFSSQKAVNQLSVELKKGKTLAIVGESGSGKSVTSLAIMGLLPKENCDISGKILWKGENIQSYTEEQRRKLRGVEMAMIFQEPMTSLNPLYTCGNQITEAIKYHLHLNKEEAHKKAIELMEEVRIPEPEKAFKKYPHELSGGQKQRVMIAMALSCNPELLIADEPTTALDVSVQKTILELLHRLKVERQLSMIFISHDLAVVQNIADDIAVMYQGTLVETGSCKSVISKPKHAYTKGLLACRPIRGVKRSRLPVLKDFVGDQSKGLENKHKVLSNSQIDKHLKTIYKEEPILKVRDLSCRYISKRNIWSLPTEYFEAVKNVNLEVHPGETLGLVGESGCGKSTLGRAILNLLPTHTGDVIFEGKNITEMSGKVLQEQRRDMQLIFQDPYSSLDPLQKVGKAIEEPLIVHGLYKNSKERREYVMNLLVKTGMKEEHYNRYPHEFSGGQRQRIAIARAIALQPKFIVCDESVSALDVSVQAQILNLLRDLQEEFKLSYLFISHDLSVVEHFCDKVLVMYQGKIIESGYPKEIISHPKEEYTRKLIEAIPQLEAKHIIN